MCTKLKNVDLGAFPLTKKRKRKRKVKQKKCETLLWTCSKWLKFRIKYKQITPINKLEFSLKKIEETVEERDVNKSFDK